jgi:hypothetical protein
MGHVWRIFSFSDTLLVIVCDRSSFKLMVKIGMDTRCPPEKTGTSWVMRGDKDAIRLY